MKSTRRALKPEQRVTAREVAELAGVSVSAVSRTFTAGACVSAATRDKVLAATQELGYQPNALARSLMTKRTELIALISNNFDNPLFMEIFDLFTRRLQQRGRRPLLANLSGGARTDGALQMLLKYSVDGAIVASSTLPPQFIDECAAAGMPVVQAFGRPRSTGSGNIVGADNVQGGRLAGSMLRERGYRNIAFLGGPQGATSTEDRLQGLRDSLAVAGLEPCAVIYGHSYCHEAGSALMKQLLRNGGIDAVFCGDDVLAMGAMDACREAGVDVPRDIGLIGFNNMAMAAWPAYNLTTIHQPVADIIVTAVELLLGIVDHSEATTSMRLFNCMAIERGTLRPR
ncbi:MAG: LacI family DNA-binding transcriptional regulator [Steroidobacterales bacterium]